MKKISIIVISILFVSIICSFSYKPIITDGQIDSKPNIVYDTRPKNNCFCSDGLGYKFCDILMRIGINIEELGKKVKPFGFVFF